MSRQAKKCNICSNFSTKFKITRQPAGDIGTKQRRINLGLMAASFVGHTPCIKSFLEKGADVNCTDEAFNTDRRKRLAKKVGIHHLENHYNPYTPVILAAIYSHLSAVSLLAKSGADVNCLYRGCTALLAAVRFGHYKCVKLLIKLGADVNTDRNVMTALTCAIENYVHSENHVKCFEILVKKGADVNHFEEGCLTTPLKLAVIRNIPAVVSRLIEAGADVNFQNLSFPLAIGMNRTEIVKLLLEAGALNAKNRKGQTALMELANHSRYAEQSIAAGWEKPSNISDTEKISFLLYTGAQIGHLDDKGRNALHLSIDGNPQCNIRDLQMILYAAGETIQGPTVTIRNGNRFSSPIQVKLPEHLQELKENLDLKNLCREAIKKHLLNLDPHTHLFGRIPKFGLPSLITEYLLYDCTLDFKKENFA